MEKIEMKTVKHLPREVYYQCIWIIKDMERLEKLTMRLKSSEMFDSDEIVFYMDDMDTVQPVNVLEAAAEKMRCIKAALDTIPEEYRQPILDNIIHMTACGDGACLNTWKKWKQKFIFELARNLNLV